MEIKKFGKEDYLNVIEKYPGFGTPSGPKPLLILKKSKRSIVR
jgi:hypothetical protein